MAEQNDTLTPAGTGQQPDTERTFSQADLDALAAKVRAEARESTKRQIEQNYGDLDALKTAKARLEELEAAQLSESEKLRKQIETLQYEKDQAAQQARAAELNTLRLRVGQEMGIPPVLAERLTGDDAESMKADAQRVLDSLKDAGRPVLPNINATEGALAGGAQGKRIKLTPGQQHALNQAQMIDPSMTEERYIAALQQIEGED